MLQACSSGRPVHLEELSTTRDEALRTNIMEEPLMQQCQELVLRATEMTQQIDSLISSMEHSLDEQQNVLTIMRLWKEAKNVPLSEKARETLKQLRSLATLLGKCRGILAGSESGAPMSLEETIPLKEEVRRTLTTWAGREGFTAISAVLTQFLRCAWRQEVAGALKSKVSVDRCQQFLEEGKHISGDVESSEEWQRLQSALAGASKIHDLLHGLSILIEGAMDEMNAIISSKSLEFNLDAFNEGCILKNDILDKYKSCITEWSRLVKALYLDTKSAEIQREENEIRLSLSLSDEARVNAELLDIISRSHQCILSVDSIFRSSEEIITGGSISMLQLDAHFKSIASVLSIRPDFLLLKLHQQYFRIIVGEVAKWEQRTSSLLPSKLTRTANKAETKTTIADLEAALREPIPRALKFNSQQRMFIMLQDAEKCAHDFLELLLPPDGSISREADAEIRDTTSNAESRNQLVWEEIGAVYNLLERMKLIPIFLPQLKVLEWYYELLQWMRGALYTDTTAPGSMSLDEARKVLEDGHGKSVEKLPESLIDDSRALGLYILQSGTWLINPRISPCIRHAKKMYDFLRVHVENANALEREALNFIARVQREKKSGAEIANHTNQLIHRLDSMITRPSNAVRRALDQIVGGGRFETVTITKTEDKLPPEKIAVIQKAPMPLKRAREEIPLLQVKRPIKDFTSRCHRRGCVGEVVSSSNYCGDTCAMLAAGELASALLEYRARLDHDSCMAKEKDVGDLNSTAKKGDTLAYRTPIVSKAEALLAVVGGLTRKGFPFSPSDDIFSSLSEGEYLNIDELDSDRYKCVVAKAEKKRVPGNASILATLPPAASLLSSVAPSKETNNSTLTAADLLNSIRSNLEEIFVNSCSRLMDAYPYVSAVLLAIEVEEALRVMYTEENNGKTALNRKECRSHYLKLARNLKFAHNDYLVLRERLYA